MDELRRTEGLVEDVTAPGQDHGATSRIITGSVWSNRPASNTLAKFIDHTNLKQTANKNDIVQLCNEAIQYEFASVCVAPYWTAFAKSQVRGSSVKLAVVIGFPFGYTTIDAKLAEIRGAIEDGADELDIVANICAIKSEEWHYISNEIESIANIVSELRSSVVLKVIIESGVLSDEEIINCCKIYGSAGITYLKTSTGFAEKGATVHAVQLFRKYLPPSVQIKASGGIRSKSDADMMIAAGATRLGCSASVQIVQEENGFGCTDPDPDKHFAKKTKTHASEVLNSY